MLAFELFVGTALALVVVALARVVMRTSAGARVLRRCALAWCVLFAAYFVGFTGPRRAHPDASTSPYRLPWPGGVERWVSQGNRSFSTHRGDYEHSFDFWMSIGSPVVAARAGTVIEVVDDLHGIGFFHGNRIVVRHDDGTGAVYAHIEKGGALVRVGETVAQGQPIARSGMVGATINPHLHFHVLDRDGKTSIPISFQDVPGDGVPRAGHSYTSGNSGSVRQD